MKHATPSNAFVGLVRGTLKVTARVDHVLVRISNVMATFCVVTGQSFQTKHFAPQKPPSPDECTSHHGLGLGSTQPSKLSSQHSALSTEH